jgi:flagellar basal body rod protein FlgC
LDEFIADLVELKTLIESIGPVNRVLADHKDTVVRRYISIRRRFDYAAFTVALYASFEKFIENLITEYVQLEARRIGDYAMLPQKLTDKHLRKSAELLFRRSLGKGRYVGMSDLGVVKNLYDCLSGTKSYVLNEVAVIAHEKNLRANEVDIVFGVVGIDKICERVCHADAMMAWYCDAMGCKAPQNGVKRTVIEKRLEDIVERRNQVAHRGGNPTDLLGDAAMKDAVAFIKSLATSIFGLVAGCYLQNNHFTSPSSTELRLRATRGGPYKKRQIVVVDKPAQRLFVGQPVFVILESTGARWGRIQSLRVDDADMQEIEANANAPNGVGVGLDFKYPSGTDVKLIALQTDDDVLWSPLELVAGPTTSAC